MSFHEIITYNLIIVFFNSYIQYIHIQIVNYELQKQAKLFEYYID